MRNQNKMRIRKNEKSKQNEKVQIEKWKKEGKKSSVPTIS